MDWDSLIDEGSLAALLPEAQAHFARPVTEGLIVFLSGLPDDVQRGILAKQAALGPAATTAIRLGKLARCCPVLHKLGQTLARDARLAPELRAQLQPLESLEPTVPLSVVQRTLTEELGPLDRRGITLGAAPLAEASVAVVVPFEERYADGVRNAVFKVLKPGIEERLALELKLLGRVAWHLDQRCVELRIPALDYRDVFAQVRDKLSQETRLDHEQANLAAAQEYYAGERDVHIPALLPHCTRRVIAMERIRGVKVTDALGAHPGERQRLASLVTRAVLARPLLGTSDHAMFHCDPHAGNLFLADDGRLAILDWSLVGRLHERERVVIAQIVLAALALNGAKIAELVHQLSLGGHLDRQALEAIVRARLQQLRRGTPPGPTWLMGLLDDATQQAGLRVSAELLLLRKSLLTLAGVVAELAGDEDFIDAALFVSFVTHFIAEAPRRLVAKPDCRSFAMRVTNSDLLELALSWPLTSARYWLGAVQDACRRLPQTL
jgi:ubiquinone biosynthesis protein